MLFKLGKPPGSECVVARLCWHSCRGARTAPTCGVRRNHLNAALVPKPLFGICEPSHTRRNTEPPSFGTYDLRQAPRNTETPFRNFVDDFLARAPKLDRIARQACSVLEEFPVRKFLFETGESLETRSAPLGVYGAPRASITWPRAPSMSLRQYEVHLWAQGDLQ